MRLATKEVLGGWARVIWTDLNAQEPVGEPQQMTELANKTIIIEGGQARLMGTNREGGEPMELTDDQGMPLKGPGIARVLLNPWRIWPELIAGDHVTVSILATKTGVF